jgi:tetratricopeptide (TPR) repeat protein
MNLEKLKDSARKFEQKEDWRKAIEVYLKAIQQIEAGVETSPDLSLYNRVGDLYLKTNDTAAAVRSYERAVDLYADQGFFNNAIALCGKILRVNPGRTQTYLKLAQLHARKNVVIEAKRNLIEFLERMNALGQLDQAFQSVKEFADQFSGSQEIRMMLVELLRAASREDEAREQLEKLAGQLESKSAPRRSFERLPAADTEEAETASTPPPSRGSGGLIFLDTGVHVPVASPARASAPEPPVVAEPPDGLMVIEPVAADVESGETAELIVDEAAVGDDLAPLPGLEASEAMELDATTEPADELGLEPMEVEPIEFEGAPLEGMDETMLDTEPAPEDGLLDAGDDLTVSVADEPAPDEAEVPVELDLIDAGSTDGLPMIDAGAVTSTVAELEGRILDDPENPGLHRELGEALLAIPEAVRGLEELELALEGYEQTEAWGEAEQVANRLAAVAPDNIRYHQKRVELAFRGGDRAPLLDAYLGLGDALARAGATDKATAVYSRVREHDPGNAHALAALADLAGPTEAAAPAGIAGAPERPAETSPAEPDSPVETKTPHAEAPPVAASTAAASTAAKPARRRPVEEGDGSFVDLGSMILDADGPRDTRMRIDRREPQDEDEQREFHEILEQFKRGLDANLEADDYQAHYDLGVAFKEMGLLDEAIAELQKALRAPEGRLRTSEALGICFFDKGQHAVSETVLRRAVETIEGGDEAKIGLLYWLGRAAEAQGKGADAIASYERALAVDIRFMDLSERIHRLTAGRRE